MLQSGSLGYFSKSTKYLFPLKKGNFDGVIWQGVLQHPGRAEDLQVLSDYRPSESATNISPENLNLDSVSKVSQHPRGRDHITLYPSNLLYRRYFTGLPAECFEYQL